MESLGVITQIEPLNNLILKSFYFISEKQSSRWTDALTTNTQTIAFCTTYGDYQKHFNPEYSKVGLKVKFW